MSVTTTTVEVEINSGHHRCPSVIPIYAQNDGNTAYALGSVPFLNGAPIGPTNPLFTESVPFTPSAGTTSQIVVGGQAVVAIIGPVSGGYIVNPESAADQGISAVEQLFVDPVASPTSASGSGNGTASSLDAGQPWTLPCAIPDGVTVRVNAATAGHKFTVVVWR